jgi:hypothetical protein
MYHNGIYGVDPTNKMIRANGELAQNGWSNIPEVETEVAAWYDAKTADEEKAAVRRLNKVALDQVVYAPLGSYLRHFAWRSPGHRGGVRLAVYSVLALLVILFGAGWAAISLGIIRVTLR